MEREKGKAGNEWSLTEKNGEMREGEEQRRKHKGEQRLFFFSFLKFFL